MPGAPPKTRAVMHSSGSAAIRNTTAACPQQRRAPRSARLLQTATRGNGTRSRQVPLLISRTLPPIWHSPSGLALVGRDSQIRVICAQLCGQRGERTLAHADERTLKRRQRIPLAGYWPKPRNKPSSPTAPAKSSQSMFAMFRLLSTLHNSDGMHRNGARPAISGNSATGPRPGSDDPVSSGNAVGDEQD